MRAPGFRFLEDYFSPFGPKLRRLDCNIKEEEYDVRNQLRNNPVYSNCPLNPYSLSIPTYLNDFHFHILNSRTFDDYDAVTLERLSMNVGKMSRQGYYYKLISNLYQQEEHLEKPHFAQYYDVRNVFRPAIEKTNHGYDPNEFETEAGSKKRMLLWVMLSREQFVEYMISGLSLTQMRHELVRSMFGDGIWLSECLTQLADCWIERSQGIDQVPRTMYCVLAAVVMKNLYEIRTGNPDWQIVNEFPGSCDSVRIVGRFRQQRCHMMKLDKETWPIRMGPVNCTETRANASHTFYKIKSPGQMRAVMIVEMQFNDEVRLVPTYPSREVSGCVPKHTLNVPMASMGIPWVEEFDSGEEQDEEEYARWEEQNARKKEYECFKRIINNLAYR